MALREGVDYHAVVLPGEIPGIYTAVLSVSGRDRGCSFGDVLTFNLQEPFFTRFRPLAAKTFQRIGCEAGNHSNGSNRRPCRRPVHGRSHRRPSHVRRLGRCRAGRATGPSRAC